MRDVKDEVQEECHEELVEYGGIDADEEVFQIIGHALEYKVGESREDNTRPWRWTWLVGARLRRFESKAKSFEPVQRGQAGDHRLG
jgi:hypothetical protein